MIPDNLPELRDIHLPQGGVSAWPPAYGWWVLLAMAVALFLLIELFLFLRRKSKKRYALLLLKNISTLEIVPAALKISEILRRICVFKYPQAAALFGREWLNFLNHHCKKQLTGPAADLLLNAPYMPTTTENYSMQDLHVLQDFCQAWIGENL